MNEMAQIQGPSSKVLDADIRVPIRNSLAASALRSSAVPITLAIMVVTLLAYALFYASIRQQQLDELALFSKERIDHEMEIFRLAQDNLATLAQDLAQQLPEISEEAARRYVVQDLEALPDGSIRTPRAGFDEHQRSQVMIMKGVRLSSQDERLLFLGDRLIAGYGLAWRNRFPNLYFISRNHWSLASWYGAPLIFDLPADFSHLDQPYFLAGTPEHNPKKVNQWTSIYRDDTSGKMMVSSITPLYLANQFQGVLGHDIYLDDLMTRTINDHPDGATNMLLTESGELLAHPDYMQRISEIGGALQIAQTEDANLKTIMALMNQAKQNAKRSDTQAWVVEDDKYDRYLVATQMGNMGWLLVTEYPQSLVSKEAFKSARTVLILGAILLLVEFCVLFVVVRRKVSVPLEKLGLAAHTWKSEKIQGLFNDFAQRQDEVGSLSREFVHLQETIDDQFDQLHREIEERKQIEETLRDQGHQLEGLNSNLDHLVQQRTHELEREVQERGLLTLAMEHALESIMIADAKMQIVYVNRMFEQQSGYARSELIGKTPMELNRFRSDPQTQQAIMDALKAGESWSGRVHNESRDGKVHEEDATLSPIRDEAGQVTHYIEVKRNITERMELERQLQSAQKLESIGQLAAGIAHEINTPTQYIGDNTKFLKEAYGELNALIEKLLEIPEGEVSKERVKGLLQEADVEYLQEEIPLAIEQCLEGVGRVSKIVRAMKEFSHPSKDKAMSDLNQAIQSTITVAANEWKYVAQMEMVFAENLPLVNCELGEINQVVLNIVVNAAHAIAEKNKGEGMGQIKVSTALAGEFAEIRIQDNGTGMPEEVKAKIFDPFFTTKEVGKGTGQGLSIAYKVIVKNHGGTIQVNTQPGEGTEFVIRLPLGSEEDAEQEAQSAPAGLF